MDIVMFSSFALVCLVAALLMNQSKLLFVPFCQVHPDHVAANRRLESNPPGLRHPKGKFKNLSLESQGVQIHAWLFHAQENNPAQIVLIYLHGNAGNIGHRIPLWEVFQNEFSRFDLLCCEYRGYGNSEGEPSESGLVQDALSCAKWARSHRPLSKIVLFGTSLGAAVAAQAWKHSPDLIDGVILENGFTSVSDMACVLLPILRPLKPVLKSPILINVFDSKSALEEQPRNNTTCPLLILCGLLDDIVPPHHSRELHRVVAERKNCWLKEFPQAGHNDLPFVGGAEYFSVIRDFCRKV